jgi:GGDEF domain-containing protein
VIVFRDVSTALALAAEMAHSAQHDFPTGLPDRMFLNARVNQAVVLAPRHAKKVAVLFLDLDGFKHINDSLGHPTGDKLLQSVAKGLVVLIVEASIGSLNVALTVVFFATPTAAFSGTVETTVGGEAVVNVQT